MPLSKTAHLISGRAGVQYNGAMPKPIRIVLADDHLILREGTAGLLRREPDLKVVGEASDGLEAIELARSLKPDVVIMDVRMPGVSGIEATRQIRETMPQVLVLVLTAHDDEQYVFSLLQAGANGYLLKTVPASELVKAIRQVVEGGMPLDPSIARKVVLHISGEADGAPPEASLPILNWSCFNFWHRA